MQNKSKSIRKKLVSGVLCLGLFTSAFAGYHFNFSKPDNVAYAEMGVLSKITNNDFYSVNSDTPPIPSSGWTAVTKNVSSDDQIVVGVFNSKTYSTNKDEYLDDYKLFADATPGTLTGNNDLSGNETDGKYKSLMINSPNLPGKYGYKTTGENIDLEANSYYRFDVTLKTLKNVENDEYDTNGYAEKFDSRASIYLKGLSDKEDEAQLTMLDSSVSAVSTTNGWATYSIFVQTSAYASEDNLSLELWLGSETDYSTGAVFFDKVTLTQYSKDTFESEVASVPSSNKAVVRLGDSNVLTSVENASFDQDYKNGWTDIEVNTMDNDGQTISHVNIANRENIKYITGEVSASYALQDKDIPSQTNLTDNASTNVLLIHNPLDTHKAIIESTPITIKQHGYYRISVWMWRVANDSTPTITLVDKNEKIDSVSQNVTGHADTASKYDGGWTQYNFYVYGGAFADNTVALQLGLDKAGYVYYDDVTVEAINETAYTKGKAQSASKEMSFNTDTVNYQVKNDSFNVTSNETSNIEYPLNPTNWEAHIDTTNSLAGVVNTTQDFTAYTQNGLYPQNPGAIGARNINNNVLMIGNIAEDLNNYYTSNSVSLGANSYYKVTAYVATSSLASTDGGAYIKLYNTDTTIFDFSNIRTSAWQPVEIYIATGNNSFSGSIDLGLNTQGFAFFDLIQVESSDADSWSYAVEHNLDTIDLSSESFENMITDSSQSRFEMSGFTGTNHNSTNVESGIADLSKEQFAGFATEAQNGHNVMYITSEENSYYSYKANTSFSLTGGTYYKISAYVITNLYEQDPNVEVDEDFQYGASITLHYGNTSQTFYGINTGSGANNEWTEYSFYIVTQSDTTATIELALGSDKGYASGLVLFDNIKMVSSNEAEYTDASANDFNVIKIDTRTEEEPAPSKDNTFNGEFSWYIIPSLITALAIFVALIGTAIRKINWKRKVKVNTSYDRHATLDKNLSDREQIEVRKQLITELEGKLKENDKTIADFKKQAKVQEKELKEKLDSENAQLLDDIATIAKERNRLEHERNSALAADKSGYTAEQDAKYQKTLKSIEKAEAKYTKELARKEKELTTLKETNKNTLNSHISVSEFTKKEIETLTKEIEAIQQQGTEEWVEQKERKASKRAKKVEVESSDIEITPPEDNK